MPQASCVGCGWGLDPDDQILSSASGRLTSPIGDVRCSPCYYRAVHPELEPSRWIIESLAAGFQVLTAAERRRLNAYLKRADAVLAVGETLFRRYWVYEGYPRIGIVACQSKLPKGRKVRDTEPVWDDFYVRMSRATDLNPDLDGLSFQVAECDATITQVRVALRRRKPKPPADVHRHELVRCLVAGLRRVDADTSTFRKVLRMRRKPLRS